VDSDGNEEVTVTRSQDHKISSHDYDGKSEPTEAYHNIQVMLCSDVDDVYAPSGPFDKFFDWFHFRKK